MKIFGVIEVTWLGTARQRAMTEIKARRFVTAIRVYREAKNLKVGLKDAKEYCEELWVSYWHDDDYFNRYREVQPHV